MEVLVTEKNFLKKLPVLPGVYRFYAIDQKEYQLLYIGKAINLQKRINSYFQKSVTLSPRISLMVKKIAKIEVTVTENEVSALILENNLIKTLKPKYNIVFRDDKTYPLIRLSKHKFPRIDSYRGKTTNADNYFGPYPNVQALKHNLDMIQRIFKLRTCNDSMFNNRSRPCMLHQIKRCTAPCVNLVTIDDYANQVRGAIDFLEGHYKRVIGDLEKKMIVAADKLEFELAAMIRDEISLIKKVAESQIINEYKQPLNADLIIVREIVGKVFIYLIMLRQGLYVGDNNFIFTNPDNDVTEIFRIFLEGYYFVKPESQFKDKINNDSFRDKLNNTNCDNKFRLTGAGIYQLSAKLVLYTKASVSDELKEFFSQNLRIKIQSGFNQQLHKLHAMGEINLAKIIDNYKGEENLVSAAAQLAKLLNRPKIDRIECIDVSHNQGENTIASVVVYAGGIMDSSQYRRYNLHKDEMGNAINGNDLLAFEIVLNRRLASSTIELPDVIVVDGGILQVNTAKQILKQHKLINKIKIVAIFKGEGRDPMKDRAILNGDKKLTIGVKDDPLIFSILHKMRDEAHRFAITGHRKKQIQRMSSSQLDEIPNIGLNKRRALVMHFGSVKNVASASIKELQLVKGIGTTLARQIYSYFHA